MNNISNYPMQESKRQRLDEKDNAKESDSGAQAAAAAAAAIAPAAPAAKEKADTDLKASSMTKDEVIRRLRVLKQPTSLFAETGEQRYERLLRAEKTVLVEDETAGGQQANLHITMQREDKEKARRRQLDSGSKQTDQKATEETPEQDLEQAQLMASFQAAADALAEKNMAVEDRISKWLKKWMKDWEDDLAARDDAVKASAPGKQADVRFKETEQYLKPLYSRLKHRNLDVILLAGIKLIIDAMKDRNYLHAYKIYMGVAIGNSPWPIGVTQVGLHERSAREKISFKYASGSAHIMNDEATRKFIQALKRLMTFCQRRYPTDPSRSVDFDGGMVHEGRGTAGAGSDKVALLEAMARGDRVAPAPAPSHLDDKGAIKIPEKWDQVLRGALKDVAASDAAEDAAALE
jgi:pre-mRNA-splicing factor 18